MLPMVRAGLSLGVKFLQRDSAKTNNDACGVSVLHRRRDVSKSSAGQTDLEAKKHPYATTSKNQQILRAAGKRSTRRLPRAQVSHTHHACTT